MIFYGFLEPEPSFFLWFCHILRCSCLFGFSDELMIRTVIVYKVVHLFPLEKPSDIAVVDIDVGVDFSCVVASLVIVTQCLVDGGELYSSFAAPLYCLIEEFSLSDGP